MGVEQVSFQRFGGRESGPAAQNPADKKVVADEMGEGIAREAEGEGALVLGDDQGFSGFHGNLPGMNLESRLLQGCSGVILVADAGSPAHQQEMGFGGEGFAKGRQKLVFAVPDPFLPGQLGGEER
jgi:hypothetical protein